MKQREDTDARVHAEQGPRSVRKPYQKPVVRHEEVFETQALICGKVHVTQGSCHNNRKNS